MPAGMPPETQSIHLPATPADLSQAIPLFQIIAIRRHPTSILLGGSNTPPIYFATVGLWTISGKPRKSPIFFIIMSLSQIPHPQGL